MHHPPRGHAPVQTVVVQAVQPLSPHLTRVRFAAHPMPWKPGDKVKLEIGEVSRSYTPYRYDASGFDVVFHLHGQGPCARWAAEARVGDELPCLGPVHSLKEGQEADWTLFLGDETTLGLARAVADSLDDDGTFFGAIELDPADSGALAALGLHLAAVPRGGCHGERLKRWLEHVQLPEEGTGEVVIAGEAQLVLMCRNALRDAGWRRDQFRIKPYWSVGGKRRKREVEVALRD